jgi:hypothetical protein
LLPLLLPVPGNSSSMGSSFDTARLRHQPEILF